MKHANQLIISALIAIFLPSCAVTMAANKSGSDVKEVQAAQTRSQILATGAVVISSKKKSRGELVETYRIQRERGSVARAFMHGVLDVSTLGLWEVIGTPIEASLDKKEYFTVRVTYDKDERVKKIELT